ncbi:peptidase inhibitor family I36 protein [Streptomyces sp. NPDC091387]|uniref:peptidase inhibitor family I36 protein n=1 Tax=unclassified Streptomyces TaxID=2593676 RepID=UPI0036673B3A
MASLLTAVALAAGFGIAGSASAAAASYDGSCGADNGGEICLYRDAGYTGGIYDTIHSLSNYTSYYTYHGTSIQLNNSVSSAWNRDPDTGARIFANAGYSGPQVYLSGNGYVYNMAEAGLNDVASSHCFTNVSGCS